MSGGVRGPPRPGSGRGCPRFRRRGRDLPVGSRPLDGHGQGRPQRRPAPRPGCRRRPGNRPPPGGRGPGSAGRGRPVQGAQRGFRHVRGVAPHARDGDVGAQLAARRVQRRPGGGGRVEDPRGEDDWTVDRARGDEDCVLPAQGAVQRAGAGRPLGRRVRRVLAGTGARGERSVSVAVVSQIALVSRWTDRRTPARAAASSTLSAPSWLTAHICRGGTVDQVPPSTAAVLTTSVTPRRARSRSQNR
jgi:hypothetical protein